MDITEDLKLCEQIIEQFSRLTTEDGLGAFKLSQLAIGMYDRLNEIRFQSNKVKIYQNVTKSDLKEYLHGKMKVMDGIYVSSRGVFTAFQNDNKKFNRR